MPAIAASSRQTKLLLTKPSGIGICRNNWTSFENTFSIEIDGNYQEKDCGQAGGRRISDDCGSGNRYDTGATGKEGRRGTGAR